MWANHLSIQRLNLPSAREWLRVELWDAQVHVWAPQHPPPASLNSAMCLWAETTNQTFRILCQWKPAVQVGTWGDTEGILFCGFRLHKHHHYLPDLGLLCCSAATPILPGTLNGDAHGLRGARAIESTKRNFGAVCVWRGSMCVMCVWARLNIFVRALTQ